MNILTLTTHMLLSIPVIYAPHMVCKIIRQPHTHLTTLHLIIATLALKQYHPIWFTEEATPPNAPPDASSATLHSLSSVAPASRTHPTPPPVPSLTRTGTAAQLLLPSLLSPNPSKKRPLPTGINTITTGVDWQFVGGAWLGPDPSLWTAVKHGWSEGGHGAQPPPIWNDTVSD